MRKSRGNEFVVVVSKVVEVKKDKKEKMETKDGNKRWKQKVKGEEMKM